MSHNRLIDRGDHSVITTTLCIYLIPPTLTYRLINLPRLHWWARLDHQPLRKYHPVHQSHLVPFDSQSRLQLSTPFIRVVLNASFHRIINVFPLPSGPSTV